MSVHHAAASRLRRARDNRPVSLCGRCEDKEEKRTFKTHESYEAHVPEALCRIANSVLRYAFPPDFCTSA